MSRAVRELDRKIVFQADDSGSQQLGQVARVMRGLLGVPAGVPGFLDGAAYQPLHVFGIAGAGRLLESFDGSPARDGDRQGPAQQHRQSDDEEDYG